MSRGRRLAGAGDPDAGAGESAPSFAARQPIYDRALDVYAYELLFRAGDGDHADVSERRRGRDRRRPWSPPSPTSGWTRWWRALRLCQRHPRVRHARLRDAAPGRARGARAAPLRRARSRGAGGARRLGELGYTIVARRLRDARRQPAAAGGRPLREARRAGLHPRPAGRAGGRAGAAQGQADRRQDRGSPHLRVLQGGSASTTSRATSSASPRRSPATASPRTASRRCG